MLDSIIAAGILEAFEKTNKDENKGEDNEKDSSDIEFDSVQGEGMAGSLSQAPISSFRTVPGGMVKALFFSLVGPLESHLNDSLHSNTSQRMVY